MQTSLASIYAVLLPLFVFALVFVLTFGRAFFVVFYIFKKSEFINVLFNLGLFQGCTDFTKKDHKQKKLGVFTPTHQGSFCLIFLTAVFSLHSVLVSVQGSALQHFVIPRSVISKDNAEVAKSWQ